MAIFGDSYIYDAEGNTTYNLHSSYFLNYTFPPIFLYFLLTTLLINPFVIKSKLSSFSTSIPSFLTCLLMVSDLLTNIYRPIYLSYKLLVSYEHQDWWLAPVKGPAVLEIFTTCAAGILTMWSSGFISLLAIFRTMQILKPLRRVSMKRVRIIAGCTAVVPILLVPGVVITLATILMPKPYGVLFDKYDQQIILLEYISVIRDVISSLCLAYTCPAAFNTLSTIRFLLKDKNSMGETRARNRKSAKVLLAISVGLIANYIILASADYSDQMDIFTSYSGYIKFTVLCFMPCLCAAYNSLMQFVFVPEVRREIAGWFRKRLGYRAEETPDDTVITTVGCETVM